MRITYNMCCDIQMIMFDPHQVQILIELLFDKRIVPAGYSED